MKMKPLYLSGLMEGLSSENTAVFLCEKNFPLMVKDGNIYLMAMCANRKGAARKRSCDNGRRKYDSESDKRGISKFTGTASEKNSFEADETYKEKNAGTSEE